MPVSSVQSSYSLAAAQWPGIAFPEPAFLSHLGDDDPPHLTDFYLAGAAGHRIQEAWTAIETNFGPKSRNILKRFPKADFTPEDLWSNTLVRTMADDVNYSPLPDGRPPAKIIRYRGLVTLLSYLITIARRIAITRNRDNRPMYSLEAVNHEDSPLQHADKRLPIPDISLQNAETLIATKAALKAAHSGFSPELQFLIAMVYVQGLKQKEAAKLVGWSEFKVSRALSDAMKTLRTCLQTALQGDWSADLAAAWQDLVRESWKIPQDFPATVSNRSVMQSGSRL